MEPQTERVRNHKQRFLDVCFLSDCDGSLYPKHMIENTMNTMNKLIDEAKQSCPNFDGGIRYSFLGYRDEDEKERVVPIDFTENPEDIKQSLAVIEIGCGDGLEDVLRGLNEILKFKWFSDTRFLIHIADELGHHKDQIHHQQHHHPLVDGDDYGLLPEVIFKEIVDKKMDYYYFKNNSSTDEMISVFSKLLEDFSGGEKNLKVFEYVENTDAVVTKVFTNVVQSVIDSWTLSQYRQGNLVDTDSLEMATGVIRNLVKKDSFDEFDRINSVKASMTLKLPPKEVLESSEKILEFIFQKKLPETLKNTYEIKISSEPFAKGKSRISYLALDLSFNLKLVAKKFHKSLNKPYSFRKSECEQFIEHHNIARHLSLAFNKLDPVTFGVEFVKILLMEVLDPSGQPVDCYMVEPFIEGVYKKFNTNCAFVTLDGGLTAETFSHWIYEKSQNQFIVIAERGVNYRLTHPSIHSVDKRFGETDMGKKGMENFLVSHICNKLCASLGLFLYNIEFNNVKNIPEESSLHTRKIHYCVGFCCPEIVRDEDVTDLNHPFCPSCREKDSVVFERKCNVCKAPFKISLWYYRSLNCGNGPSRCKEHRTKPTTRITYHPVYTNNLKKKYYRPKPSPSTQNWIKK